uniref:BTB domain-containing protein n=1 Tax=Steinernema glaseri TaxID=37863 RepID=A0A1I8AUB6_9BILA
MARLLVTLLALGCVVAAVSGYAYPASYHPYNPYNANYEYNPYFPYANAPVRGHYSYGSTNMNCHPLYGCGKDVAIESTLCTMVGSNPPRQVCEHTPRRELD